MAQRHRAGTAIVTLCVRSAPARTPSDNPKRVALLRQALLVLSAAADWPTADAIVLPAGYFRIESYLGNRPYAERLRRLAKEQVIKAAIDCCAALAARSPGVVLILGIDATRPKRHRVVDQWCVVCNGANLVAVVRKIFPTATDIANGFVPAVADYAAPQRLVALSSGKTALLCVCYDTFGVNEDPERPSVRSSLIARLLHHGRPIDRRHHRFQPVRRACVAGWRQLLDQKRPSIAIAVIHRFKRPGLDGYWQRHGIATASAVLGGFAVGAAHFGHLPESHEAPLAASHVPARHVAAGNRRRAWRCYPSDDRPVRIGRGVAAVLRLYLFES